MAKTGAGRLWRVSPRRAVVGSGLAVALLLGVAADPVRGNSEVRQPQAVGIELVGHTDLGGRGSNAAVWGHRGFAYVGSWGQRGGSPTASCPALGVSVVNLADPTQPAVVGSVAQRPGTSAEDVHVLAVDTTAFRGDLLAAGVQRCAGDAPGGLSLWDVTDPRRPSELGFFDTGRGTAGVHELDLFRRDERTIGLLAVPFSETLDAQRQGDLRIVDLSDPRSPVQLADWGIGRALGWSAREGLGRDSQNYAHSVRASQDGRLAYVSYWDAGVIILDISDLRNPRYLGRTTFDPTDEGNAHSATAARGGRLLVQADEDTNVRTEALLVQGVPRLGLVEAAFGAFRPLLDAVGGVAAAAAYVGRGCPVGGTVAAEDPYIADPRDKVAIVDRGDCTFVEKVARAQANGAVAVVIANRDSSLISPDGDAGGIRVPAALIRQEAGDLLKDAVARGESVTVSLSPDHIRYDDWGGLRFWDLADPANPTPVATYLTPNAATDRADGPPDDGWYTAHHAQVLGDRLYVSWYSDGVRVLDIANPTRPREVGSFIPPAGRSGGPSIAGRPDRPFVWGIYARGDVILASDHNTGLYILRELAR